MWFYIYIDRQSTNVQNFGTICWFWPWFISSRSRLLFHKLLQRYCNLELDIISFLWCLGLTLIFINFRTSIQGKEMIVTFCISQRGQSKDCVAQRRMGRKLPYKLSQWPKCVDESDLVGGWRLAARLKIQAKMMISKTAQENYLK